MCTATDFQSLAILSQFLKVACISSNSFLRSLTASAKFTLNLGLYMLSIQFISLYNIAIATLGNSDPQSNLIQQPRIKIFQVVSPFMKFRKFTPRPLAIQQLSG